MVQPGQPQVQSRRPVIIGVLNLVAAAFYLLLAINATNSMNELSGLPSSVRDSVRTMGVIDIAADGVACVGMFLGGLFLLQKRALGRTITRGVAGILVAAIVILACFLVSTFGGAAVSILIPSVLGLLLRFAYPIIVARLLNPSPAELGLS
jgi:hypothetical protein